MSAPVDHAEARRVARTLTGGEYETVGQERLLANAYLNLVSRAWAYTDSNLDYDDFEGTDEEWDQAVRKAHARFDALVACLPPNPETER